jgi:putative NIF3 family GTP cyclohydrolase 1 type 2
VSSWSDAYLDGEISEQQMQRVRDGVACVVSGHRATQKGGVQPLGEHLAARFGLEHRYIDISIPVRPIQYDRATALRFLH